MLDELNDFSREGSIKVHQNDREFQYSDGRESELYLKKVLEQAVDLSSASAELESAIQDWSTEYHLSSKRANLLRGLDLGDAGTRVLEIGCGCGAITRYLGEKRLSVDAIEGSGVRAELAGLRCRDLPDVQVYCANFNDLELPGASYDVVLLVGVAEYAARFMNLSEISSKPVVSFLARVKEALKPSGVIIIAIENRVGLKYMMGAHEDHYGQRFVGIHNYFGGKDINTYSLAEWETIVEETGLHMDELYLPFPDYKLPTLLLSRDYANDNPYAFCHLDGIESRDYVDRFKPEVRESLLWQALSAGKAVDQLSNSFLFLLSSGAGRQDRRSYDFVHLPDFRRRREYCLITCKKRDEDVVSRRKLLSVPTTGEKADHQGVVQRVEDEPYHAGILLSVEWARALEIEPDGRRFTKYVTEYVTYIRNRDELTIDLTPSNIVVTADGRYEPFDEEWLVKEGINVEFLLFRSLLIFVVKAREAVQQYARRCRLRTIEDFILYIGDQVSVDLSRTMPAAIGIEERFQAAVAAARDDNATRRLLKTKFRERGPLVDEVQTRLYWREPGGSYSEEASLVKYLPVTDNVQFIHFALPPVARRASHIRFDPCDEKRDDGVGLMRIHGMRVRTVKPGSEPGEVVWSLERPDDIAAYAQRSGLRYANTDLGTMFMVSDDDPWLELEFVPLRSVSEEDYLRFEIELTIPFSREYLLALDQHLVEAERLAEKGQKMDEVYARYSRLETELKDIKSTRFWRLFAGYVRIRHRLARNSNKAYLWLALFQNLGIKRGSARLRRMAGKHLARVTRRRPEAAGPPTHYELWRDVCLQRSSRPVRSGPLISVIMPVYNAKPGILKKAIVSVQGQIYDNWELCIADDASTTPETRSFLKTVTDTRIKIRLLDTNLNISGATNAAAEMATGQYLAFMDNDDELADDALNAVAMSLMTESPDCLYTDEDFIKVDGHLDDPHFKTDYNPDLLLSHNYVTHLLVVSRALFEDLGGMRSEFDGAQDYDLILRAFEKAQKIFHLPKPVYHWRKSETSTALNPLAKSAGQDNARKALQAALQRRGIDGQVKDTALPHFFRVQRTLRSVPRVTVVIPFRDRADLLRDCVESVLKKTTYGDIEILGISNNSRNSSTYVQMERLRDQDSRVVFRELNATFNFSRLADFGVEHATGQHIVFLSNEIQIISPDWIEGLLEHSQRPEVAAVGAKLYYPNNRIRHAGVGIGIRGCTGHFHYNFRADSPGYFNRLCVTQNVSAVSAALMMVDRDKYRDLEGFDEHRFTVGYGDVDFCLRAREAGLLNVFTPFVEAYHGGPKPCDRAQQSSEREQAIELDRENLRKRHAGIFEHGDPYYNPNFDPHNDDFRLPVPPVRFAAARS